MNRHLSNDGVEETPPATETSTAAGGEQKLFTDLEGANVGFQYWPFHLSLLQGE